MIRVRELTKRFGKTTAVNALTFTVEAGVVTGFLGPNGAGKTTTLRMILGLDRPTSGTATVGGRRFADLPAPLRTVGALLDARAVHGGRTACQHLLCLARSNGISRSRVREVLGLVGLETVADRRVRSFSLGMFQRLGIAAALLGDPPVLLLDEPVNGLDPEGIVWLRTLLRSLAAEGRTVVLSSHLMSEMALTADRLIVIGRGELIAHTAVDDFVRTNSPAQVRVRTPHAAALSGWLAAAGGTVTSVSGELLDVTGLDSAAIGTIAADCGAVLYELTPGRASLEEAFMALTSDSIEFGATEGAVR